MGAEKKGTGSKHRTTARASAAGERVSAPRGARAAAPARRGAERGAPTTNAFRLQEATILRMLRTGEQAAQLREYFGDAAYEELRELARETSVSVRRRGERVLILPGIMGSSLGQRRALLDDVIWIDPLDLARGRIERLALPGGARYVPLGVVLFTYLQLKLRLDLAGFDAQFHPFDWRRSILDLGRELATFIDESPATRLHVVAHSMGGLVTRASIPHLSSQKLGRFVMLGTPNYGSFVPVQALRGRSSLVAKLALLDLRNDPADWARKVLHTFPGLHEMLPFPEKFSSVDLFSAASWPGTDPRPAQALLKAARAVHAGLAPADSRFALIAGVGRRTVVGLASTEDGFVYQESDEGDDTVPLAFCRLPNADTYYVNEAHGSLPNNARVIQAAIDLLRTGETRALDRAERRARAAVVRQLRERDITPQVFEGRRPGELTASDRREVIDEVAAPSASPPEATSELTELPVGTGYAHRFAHVVVTRRREHALEIQLALGNITEVNARALVLGMFSGVEPAGAAQALDEVLDGAIKEVSARRMFSARVGQVFMLPTGRSRLLCDSVLFAGLGDFGAFSHEVLEFVAENIVRTFVRSHVDDFALVLLGAASGRGVEGSLRHLFQGFVRGLLDADTEHRLRRITLCELSPERYRRVKEETYRLASTSLFDQIRVTLCETALPERVQLTPPARPHLARVPETTYLYVTQEERERVDARRGRYSASFRLRSSLLTAGSKAAVLSGESVVDPEQVDALLERVANARSARSWLLARGRELAEAILPADILRGLSECRGSRLVVVHDAPASRFPWEIVCVPAARSGGAEWFPAEEAGLSRHYAAANLSVAKWLEQRRRSKTLDLLLVVNPTGDLDGTLDEAGRIEQLAAKNQAIRVRRVEGPDATRERLLSELGSGAYDVVHYAGHAFFDPDAPASSGVVCHGDVVLSGAQLAGLASLPALAFFNACEAGKVRGPGRRARAARRGTAGKAAAEGATSLPQRIARNVGLAEAFMRGGVANYVGTFWPVGDEAAAAFASAFYGALLGAEPMGKAVQAGRLEARGSSEVDWADYIHYGDPDFVLKGLGS